MLLHRNNLTLHINVVSGVMILISSTILKKPEVILYCPYSEGIKQVRSYRYLCIHLVNLLSWNDVGCFSCTDWGCLFSAIKQCFILSVCPGERCQAQDVGVVWEPLHAVKVCIVCSEGDGGGLENSPSRPSVSSLCSDRRREFCWTSHTFFTPSTSSCLLTEGTVPKCKLNLFKISFLPTSIKILSMPTPLLGLGAAENVQ